jgi:EAL domain-containing protein (putative c-di-GMP-specific phosphodiesterase class I)
VTETAVLEDVEGASARLRAVRDMGVKVSVDDFGTGYSSLSYLQKLPIDELKIDRTFVAPMPYDAGSSAIVASVIGLAHAIGLTVVAEGVETERHLDELTRLDCDLAQGYYLARPAPAAALTARLTDREFVTRR